jgi:hypothetical protein
MLPMQAHALDLYISAVVAHLYFKSGADGLAAQVLADRLGP